LSDADDLTGKLLIAMPGMMDDRFSGAVVFLCAHSTDGAMGIVINRLAPGVALSDILEQLSIDTDAPAAARNVLAGGPVEQERGFVLHSTDYASTISTLHVTRDIAMTATMDIMEDIARDEGPARMLVALGYCGWGPGQLERELAENAWLTCDGAPELVFGADMNRKWEAALRTLGVNPLTLSSTSGRA